MNCVSNGRKNCTSDHRVMSPISYYCYIPQQELVFFRTNCVVAVRRFERLSPREPWCSPLCGISTLELFTAARLALVQFHRSFVSSLLAKKKGVKNKFSPPHLNKVPNHLSNPAFGTCFLQAFKLASLHSVSVSELAVNYSAGVGGASDALA